MIGDFDLKTTFVSVEAIRLVLAAISGCSGTTFLTRGVLASH